ncbi:Ger(x)C family spore germination protein [Neobacillus sp. CF12]|uniref:Ger(x)C family spore germination protein n=1 Tax=Neobacillus sp. CF12 TaxID=3055864 RepID=UPI0025A280B3|nr:Ger(x)C family spore germination protein [Neobacillus sp. CF12]MDM5326994.1 Ger(x)C family spore germination protein [Neobacillus sp. CF12]
MQNKLTVLNVLCCLFLTGCGASNVIEDLAIIESVAYDLSESGKNPIKTTVLFPTVSKEGKAGTKTLTANGKSSHETFIKLQNSTNLKLVGGQTTILFGEELSKKGLIKIVKSFTRDPEVGTRVKFAIVEGKGEELLKKKMPSIPDNAEYLYTFIEKLGTQNKVLNTDKYRFLRDYYDDGIDPVLPIFSYIGENIELKGLGSFKGDQYVTRLTLSETQILNFLNGDIKNGNLMISINDDKSGKNEQLFLRNINSNNDKKVNTSKTKNMMVEVIVDLKGSVLEYTGEIDLSEEKYQRQLEKQVENYLITNSKKLLTKLQKYQTDPIGIGTLVRNRLSYERWNKMKWEKIYSSLNIKVKVHVELVNTGKSK